MKKRGIILIVAAMSVHLPSMTQAQPGRESGVMEEVMRFLGVDSPEQVDEYDFERLSGFAARPLRINETTSSRLIASGLFTQYQAASLLDYIRHHGDVLSLSELSAIEGFSAQKAQALAPFLSFDPGFSQGHGRTSSPRTENTLALRTNLKRSDEDDYSYGVKYRLTVGERFQFGISANRSYGGSQARPDGGSFYLALYGKRRLGKIVIGDFNLRYGQGLALWNGFRTEGLSSPESFYRRPSGLSPYWSFTGGESRRGLAADFNIGRFTVSASLAFDGLKEMMTEGSDALGAGRGAGPLALLPAVNVAWLGKNAQISLTGYATAHGSSGASDTFSGAGTSVDLRWCISGVDLFSEVALDVLTLKTKAVAGAVFAPCEGLSLATRASCLDDRYSLAAGGRFYAGDKVRLSGKTGFGADVSRHSGTFSVEAMYFPEPKYGSPGPGAQMKILLNYALRLSPCLCAVFRLSERLRNGDEKLRSDLRADLKYSSGDWMAVMRLNGVYNKDISFLAYAEGGWKPDWMSVYARLGVFLIDNWQDRIYVYERDAPGNFNVPAYYGRGCWGAVTVSFKLLMWLRAYLRLSTVQYPWRSPTASERTARSECRIFLSFEL